MKQSFQCFFSLILLVSMCGSGYAKDSKHYILYVGTYTTGDSKGIYAYRYDANTGGVQSLGLAAETTNPSFITADGNARHLFAVNELQKYNGQSSGGVSSFKIDPKTGKLSRLDEVASHGADPCYISIDRSGKYLLVANYTGGNVAVIPILPDGRLAEASSVEKDQGALGPDKDRQESPHAHWIQASAHNRFAYVSDLGLDRVLIYKFDASKGVLGRDSTAQNEDFFAAKLAPGTGPRHVAFSANGKFMYVLGELNGVVTVFANDANEKFQAIQEISGLPTGFSGQNTAAEIAIDPSGKYLYTSNRGDDSIAEFHIDKATGRLALIGHVPSGGKGPRNFVIDPRGTHLLVANQDTGNIVEYSIDTASGKLTHSREIAKVPSAVCLLFFAVD
jgi:6-phosphogluconolactonase